jgi:hydroxymethylbilane synthase
VGQGALVIEIRKDSPDLLHLLQAMQHHETAVITSAERGVMSAVEGDCKTPVAAFGERLVDALRLRAMLAEPDGTRLRRDELSVPFPETQVAAFEVGRALGLRLKSA